jgi:hypothetical protein
VAEKDTLSLVSKDCVEASSVVARRSGVAGSLSKQGVLQSWRYTFLVI